jgi:hypothetical protein
MAFRKPQEARASFLEKPFSIIDPLESALKGI